MVNQWEYDTYLLRPFPTLYLLGVKVSRWPDWKT